MTQADQPVPPAALPPLSDLIRGAAVAAMFGCCERTIRRWCAAGHLMPVRIGRAVFFRTDDIRRLIATDMAAVIVKHTTARGQQSSDPSSGGDSDSNDSLSSTEDFQSD